MDLNTVDELVVVSQRSAIATWREGDAWLGGGTALFAEPQPQLRRLLDLTGFGWQPITTTAEGVDVAATCTLAELSRHPIVLFGQCCRALLGSFKVQNMATVGGNMCSALPAGPMIAWAVALQARCEIWSPDGTDRTVDALDFITGPSMTCLRPGELLRRIVAPATALTSQTAFAQTSLSHLGRSAALVIARSDADGRTVFTVTASTPRPVRFGFDRPPSASEVADACAAQITEYYDDVHGHPAWRAAMTARLLEQVRAELSVR